MIEYNNEMETEEYSMIDSDFDSFDNYDNITIMEYNELDMDDIDFM